MRHFQDGNSPYDFGNTITSIYLLINPSHFYQMFPTISLALSRNNTLDNTCMSSKNNIVCNINDVSVTKNLRQSFSHTRQYCVPLLLTFLQLTFGTGVLHLIQINHQPDATIFQFIILTFIYSSTCFGSFPAHHHELNDCSGSLWFYLRIVVTVVLCSWSGRSFLVRVDFKS